MLPNGNHTALPPPGTVERWAFDYIVSRGLAHKLAPPPPPDAFERGAPPRRLVAPGRPPELTVVARTKRSVRQAELRSPCRRAELVHTFLHHELQAAELFAWALCAFPATEEAFRRGLLRVFADEVRHMRMYRDYLERHGVAFGDFPVRDWFWQRVPRCASAVQFVALLGLGLEGGNLDHAERFADWFDAAGDAEGAALQRAVGADEVGHVAFAGRWFRAWTGGLDFDRWVAELPAPLSPTMLRGALLNSRDRRRAGFPTKFLERLDAWDRA